MHIIVPEQIFPDSDVYYTNLPEEEFATWASGASYPQGSVVKTVDGAVWRAVYDVIESSGTDESTGQPFPPLSIVGVDPSGFNTVGFDNSGTPHPGAETYARYGSPWWEDVTDVAPYLQNRYKMFSSDPGTTTTSSSIVFTLWIGSGWQGLALLGVCAEFVAIRFIGSDGSQVIAQKVFDNRYENPISNYFPNKTSFVLFNDDDDLGGHFNSGNLIEVSLINSFAAGYNVSCSNVVVGEVVNIGTALMSTSVQIMDYSRKEVDTWGELTIIERGYSDVVNYKIEVETDRISQIQSVLADRRARPSVYVGDRNEPATIVYGLYNDFTLPYESWKISKAEIEVSSLVKNSPVKISKRLKVGTYEGLEFQPDASGSVFVIPCDALYEYNASSGEWESLIANSYLFVYSDTESMTNIRFEVSPFSTIEGLETYESGFNDLKCAVFSCFGNQSAAPILMATVYADGFAPVQIVYQCNAQPPVEYYDESTGYSGGGDTTGLQTGDKYLKVYQGRIEDAGSFLIGSNNATTSVVASVALYLEDLPVVVYTSDGNTPSSDDWAPAENYIDGFYFAKNTSSMVISGTRNSMDFYIGKSVIVGKPGYGSITIHFA